MTQITELGYVGLGVKSIEDWKHFAAKVVGLEVVESDDPKSCHMRMDSWYHRLIIQEDGTDDLAYLGFRVAGLVEFREMKEKLEAAGVKVRVGTLEEAEERHVLEIMKLNDPSGNPLEIFHGPHLQADKPFYPGRRMYGKFKTGSGGLGHMLLRETVGFEKTHEFYSLLGMRGSVEYKIPFPGMPKPLELMFMDCNDRDHTLAFGAFPGADKLINHLMFEYESFDDVGLAYGIIKQEGIKVNVEPGRHANDEMYSVYITSPSDWMVELGWGARPATHQSEYYQGDTYGHDFA